jgi:hypothetical protein
MWCVVFASACSSTAPTDAGPDTVLDAPRADAPVDANPRDVPHAVDGFVTGRQFVRMETTLVEPQWRETYPVPCTLGDNTSCTSLRMGGGAAVRDVDMDGDLDVFLTHFEAPDVLYVNQGGWRFEPRTMDTLPEFNFSNGAAFADIENDGDADLLVGTVGEERFFLLVNDGRGGFNEVARTRQVAQPETDGFFHSTTSSCFGDFDLDGFLDLATSEWRVRRSAVEGSRNSLLRNRGTTAPGFYRDETTELGVRMEDVVRAGAWGFTPMLTDVDGDDRPDLLVAADFDSSRLFWNDGERFIDGTVDAGVGTDENGMGSALGDYDNDGDLDWFVTAIFDDTCAATESCHWGTSGNRLYRNDGDRQFTDVTDEAGVRDAGWGWGTRFFDFDLDGDLDLVVTNGMRHPPASTGFATDPMRLWRNNGDGTFTDVAAELGLIHDGVGRAVVTFDADGDGDHDLLITHSLDAPALFRNDVADGRAWLEVATVGTTSNRDGYGAVVRVWPTEAAPPMLRVAGNGCGFLGNTPGTPHFGLNELDEAARVEVYWPASGQTQTFTNVSTRQRLVVTEP